VRAFRCIGAECEDTCCSGWIVNVDKPTFEAWRRCDDSALGPRLRDLVTINTARTSDDNYSRITLVEAGCPFLAEGLCAIQVKLGEEYLPYACAMYPRVTNAVDDVLHRSLDLSCPEAARIVLLDPGPMEFEETESSPDKRHPQHLTTLRTQDGDSNNPYRYFREIRGFIIALLQYRAYPLWKRLVILALFCDRLHDLAEAGQASQTIALLKEYQDAIQRDLFEQALNNLQTKPGAHLEMVLEMIVDRIGSDATSPRFLACYREFMRGIEWTPESGMDDIGRRYAAASARHYEPFMRQHDYMLEHWLVSYVHRTLFPLGAQETDREPGGQHIPDSIRDQCLLMMIHYAVIQTVLIGVAGLHNSEFGPDHVIRVVQSASRAFGHSLTFPGRALRILADKGVRTCASLAMFLRN
jgi:lysine-N-methylase